MSSRPCNYCNVKWLREEAAKTGATVHVVASPLMPKKRRAVSADLGFPDGKDVFVVPKGKNLDTTIDDKGNHGPQWKMWAAALPDKCAC
jgi:hypothetical protein